MEWGFQSNLGALNKSLGIAYELFGSLKQAYVDGSKIQKQRD